MQIDDEKSLQLLRKIFLEESNQKQEQFEIELNKLRYQLTDKEAKIEAFYPIISDLLERKIIDSEDELTSVLSPLMGKAIKKQVNDSKDDIIDALYPIMGDAIKRSVSEGIKEIYTSINLKIDKALRRGIFSKQIKSKITGVSTSDLLLHESFPFSIDEIFLIHESSGLLISHVSSSESKMSSDGDLISGLLTAIKDFVAESFKSSSGSQNLYEIQYGNSRIILERGLYSYLAIVISGQEPVHFHSELSDLNSNIYDNHQKQLRDYNGELIKNSKIELFLNDFIDKFRKIEAVQQDYKPSPILLYLFLSLIGIALIIFGIIKLPQYFEDKSIENQVGSKLEQIHDININDLDWSSDDGNLIISGFVDSYKVKNQIDSTVASIPELESFSNISKVGYQNLPREEIIKYIEQNLLAFETSDLSYQLVDEKIILEGKTNSDDEKRKIAYSISRIPGLRVVINNIEINSQNELSIHEIRQLINNTILTFNFIETELTLDHKTMLNEVLEYVSRYHNARLIITSCSVGENNSANLAKAKERGENVRDYLSSKGFSLNKLEVRKKIIEDPIANTTNSERFVQLELSI